MKSRGLRTRSLSRVISQFPELAYAQNKTWVYFSFTIIATGQNRIGHSTVRCQCASAKTSAIFRRQSADSCNNTSLLVHIAITYGAPGLWYYKEGQLAGPEYYVFLAFNCTCQAFFMGLLFLLAGYFTPASYDRKGPGQFTLDRLTRLWLPVGVFIFLIDPFMQYALTPAGILPSSTGSPMTLQAFLGLFANPLNGLGFGPLWFIEALSSSP